MRKEIRAIRMPELVDVESIVPIVLEPEWSPGPLPPGALLIEMNGNNRRQRYPADDRESPGVYVGRVAGSLCENRSGQHHDHTREQCVAHESS